ncbi:hypothetical protein [Roseateles terrae]|uniref:DUF3380 domain-containing protein n=1 Tax=Roseateles terrae TaxID=431060 RepID=A0ABR6GN51_9BURK|nr:hypothetical protein [Roseateles terrae]MBB3193141.1 hypothetical protein [Roseateles terrae]
MKDRRILVTLAICTMAATVFAKGGGAVAVRGYVKKDGTYVAPHMRSAPDANFQNNWSTTGNVNPYTGEPGKVETAPAAQPGVAPAVRTWTPPPHLALAPQVYVPAVPVLGGESVNPLASQPEQPLTVAPEAPMTPPVTPAWLQSPLVPVVIQPHPTPVFSRLSPPATTNARYTAPLTGSGSGYLQQQKAKDAARAQFWRDKGYSFDPTYMSAYAMDQKAKDIERASFWKQRGYTFSAEFMSAYAMDQKVKDIERATFWQARGHTFNPEYMSAYAMDQKVKDISRAQFWATKGLNFNPDYMSAYAMDQEAARRGLYPR